MNKHDIVSDLPVHPGEYLAEVLDCLSLPRDGWERVIDGTESISWKRAKQLERKTNVATHVWVGLWNEYVIAKKKEKARKENV